MNRKNQYRDMEKYKKTRNRQKRRYYGKTAIYKKRYWTEYECKLVLQHSISDTELSSKIERSVAAIQKQRCKMKKELKLAS